jgi:hypothetical protein
MKNFLTVTKTEDQSVSLMESRKHLKTELTSTLNIPPQILPKI